MGCMWLSCCGKEDAAAVRSELIGRDAASRILWVSEPERLPSVARRFAGEKFAVALALRGVALDVTERVLGDIARDARGASILVFADVDDPGVIARCFYAGATEVVAAGGASGSCELEVPRAARAGEERAAAQDECPLVDEEAPPWRREEDVRPVDAVAGNDSPAAVTDGSEHPASRGSCEEIRDTTREAADEEFACSATPAAASVPTVAAVDPDAPRAPLITVIAGRGGCGRTTLVASMATCAARAGLRVAVLDLDLMFGTLPLVLGIDAYVGFEGLSAHSGENGLVEQDIEATAMRIGPGLTLWGPCAVPEHAELVCQLVEQLVHVLRGMADVILVDTSTSWGDAAAMAVSACDRCLVVGSAGAAQVSSAKRAIELAARLGVPRTRMTCVFNRVGARGCGEEQALHFEMGVSLRSRARIAYGGDEVTGMASFGRFDSLMAGSGPFAQSVRELTSRLLRELGCPVDAWLLEEEQRRASTEERPRIRLPWSSRERGEP